MKLRLFVLMLLMPMQLAAQEVNLYSARKEALIKPLLDQFTEETGIKVNLVAAKADTLLKRLEVEGRATPADILLTVDAARLVRGKDKGLFQPIDSAVLERAVPEYYRDRDRQWFGLSLRSRVIVYAPERVGQSALHRYLDLADARWRGRICVRSSSNIYNQSLVAAIIARYGIEKTERWAKALVGNFARPPKGGDRDQIKAVAAGACDIALVNNYYLAAMLTSPQREEVSAAKKVKLFWPDQDGHGAHINVSGAAVLKSARHRQEAVRLLEFLVSDAAQRWYAEKNHEYPVSPQVESGMILRGWGDFKADNLALDLLGEHNAAAVKLMDRVGWR